MTPLRACLYAALGDCPVARPRRGTLARLFPFPVARTPCRLPFAICPESPAGSEKVRRVARARATLYSALGTQRRDVVSQIEDLVAAYRILAEHRNIDAYGHVSVRDENDPNRYLLARSLAPEVVTEADIITYDLDSKPLDDNGRVSVRERFIHGEIYKTRPDVMAVVHNHSPTVVPFSITGVHLRPLFHMAAFVGLGVPLFEIRDFEKGTDLLVKSNALGAALAGVLGDKPAALMRGHGAVVVGREPAARGGTQRLPGDERADAATGAGARGARRHYVSRRWRGGGIEPGTGLQPRLADVAGEGATRAESFKLKATSYKRRSLKPAACSLGLVPRTEDAHG